jgi:hypothetical protein
MLSEGDTKALGGVFQFGLKFYACCAFLFAVVVGIGSVLFFKEQLLLTKGLVIGLLLSIVGTALSLFMVAFTSILEGVQQAASLYKGRLLCSIFQFIVTVAGLSLGFGVATIGFSAIFSALTLMIFVLLSWRELFARLFKVREDSVFSWSTEVWPFQKRMFINSVCAYSAWSLATPIVFRCVGPVEAGQYALSWGILRSICGFSASWTYTKLGKFGQMVGEGRGGEMQSLARRMTIIGVVVYCVGALLYVSTVFGLSRCFPVLADRFGPMGVIVTLGIVNLMHLYLLMRSHLMHAYGCDGFVEATVAVTVATIVLQVLGARYLGGLGVALGMLMPLATMVFFSQEILRRTIRGVSS